MQILYYILISAHTKDIKNAITMPLLTYLLLLSYTTLIYIPHISRSYITAKKDIIEFSMSPKANIVLKLCSKKQRYWHSYCKETHYYRYKTWCFHIQLFLVRLYNTSESKKMIVGEYCLFVSRVRLSVCLSPDWCVGIFGLPLGCGIPSWAPLRVHTLGCGTK